MAVTDVLLRNLMALSTLYYVNAEMVKIASIQWGMDPHYVNRKIRHSTLEEINTLRKLNVDKVQGYYLGRPQALCDALVHQKLVLS